MNSSFEQNGGTYRQVGIYLILNLTLPPEAKKSIGILRQKHRATETVNADLMFDFKR